MSLNGVENFADLMIVFNADHLFLGAQRCQQIDSQNSTILLEPIDRNTALPKPKAQRRGQKTYIVISRSHMSSETQVLIDAIETNKENN